MESHVLGGDPGLGPREKEAPLQLPAASFPDARRERRLERLSALTPSPSPGRHGAPTELVPTEGLLAAGVGVAG